ncbi:putative 3-hydroxyacyl-CoA dehydrogenase type II [Oceaniovalibus guishaninsula JLT2003]|uniref:Putative 3-hydroxyacyl-CoA dehydrogenase type II n=1 Tax=Oceaniovalibus guishaninsula JLT2003 TaxID=1231392 RepID=K2HBG1_9RHOB|nr:SDR family NAD(P)-dependent oxidoreductase [Oceaniovalibus guishaninsula]EKE43962.1 putative 3-hydroxyacyl-CoA dehydrogenase type II [Oceaniovalibus guishaninsula JLT2003]
MKIGQNTRAIVTGGASGLGGAVVAALLERDASVTVFDLSAGPSAATHREVDVTDAAAVARAMVEARDAMGGLDLLVNCAGIAPGARTVGRQGAHDAALFAKVVQVNLIGSFNCASQAAALMSENEAVGRDGERGVIVHTASIAAWEGQIGQVAYAASKAGIVGMTLPMARDLAGLGIRVCAIAPGLFLTPMMQGLPEDVQASLGGQTPFPQRLGDPAEFAALALHVAENPMLNGEVIRLDGAIRLPPR